ncbi:MAG: hypothetical protein JXP73_05245 [Deltaproteobacteria bacterium]|nr:hypothetical protein [Deltaproteobacteria bacterium]
MFAHARRVLPVLLAVFVSQLIPRPAPAKPAASGALAQSDWAGQYPPDYGPPPGYAYPPPGYAVPPGYYYPPPPDTPPPYVALPDAPPPDTPPAEAGPPAAETPSPGSPAAAVVQPAAPTPRPFDLGVAWSTAILSENDSTSVVNAPWLEGAYAVHARVLLALGLGFGWLADNQGLAQSTFRAANPQLSVHYRATWGRWRLQAGLGATAPVAGIPRGPDGRLYAFLYNRTLAMGGMWNQWLWLPDRMATPLMLRARYAFDNGIVFLVEQADALVFGVRNGAGGTDFVGQLAIQAHLPLGSRFELGPRLQTVLLPEPSLDRWQSAAALRAVYKSRFGRFFLGLLANLDEPIAAQSGLQRWSLHLGKEIDL